MTTHTGGPPSTREQETAVPRTFFGYLRSFGPGLIIVMTWLGAGDIVEMSVAGGNYGYALMWVIVLAVAMRYVFVSLVAKYQLCNPHGEGVLDGLSRLHWLYAPMLMVSAIVMGHVYESYVTVGIGEAFVNLFGRGTVWGVGRALERIGPRDRLSARVRARGTSVQGASGAPDIVFRRNRFVGGAQPIGDPAGNAGLCATRAGRAVQSTARHDRHAGSDRRVTPKPRLPLLFGRQGLDQTRTPARSDLRLPPRHGRDDRVGPVRVDARRRAAARAGPPDRHDGRPPTVAQRGPRPVRADPVLLGYLRRALHLSGRVRARARPHGQPWSSALESRFGTARRRLPHTLVLSGCRRVVAWYRRWCGPLRACQASSP